MDLVFNEVSLLPLVEERILLHRFIEYLKVFSKAREDYGFDHVIFPNNIRNLPATNEKTFFEWVYSIEKQSYKNQILSLVKKPFVGEVLDDHKEELQKFYYKNEQHLIEETYCEGLATAHVKDLLCSSLSSPPFLNSSIKFNKIINDLFETEEVSAKNVVSDAHLQLQDIKTFVENIRTLILVETELTPEEKAINLRDDHGSDILEAFAQRIIMSPYVTGVINSLPFNPRRVNLIKKIATDGKIEMVLYWEDAGYGMVIQTTGRNYRETQEIAKILKNEFDR